MSWFMEAVLLYARELLLALGEAYDDNLFVGFLASAWYFLWLVFGVFVLYKLLKIVMVVPRAIFCLLFRKPESLRIKECRKWFAERYRLGDVMWLKRLWQYSSWSRNFLLLWPRLFATREAVFEAEVAISSMEAEVAQEKKQHWLKYQAQLLYAYSAKEMERRTEAKEIVEKYEERLWRVSCIALFEYDEIRIFRIMYPEDVTKASLDMEKQAFHCEYDEAALVEKFVPWLQSLERSYADIEQMMKGRLWLKDNLSELRQRCEERFFATYYRFGEKVPVSPEYQSEIVMNPMGAEFSEAKLRRRLAWRFFVRCVLKVGYWDDDKIVWKNISRQTQLYDLKTVANKK